MKHLKILFVPVLLVALTASGERPQRAPDELVVMSFNIRYANENDGRNAWQFRKDRVAGIIRASGAHSVGLQEALRGQIDSLESRLSGYSWVGVGRVDGSDAGEFSPIFYRSHELTVELSGTFWLSPWPDSVGSRGWDAALPRIVTWARMKILDSGVVYYHFNTHFDHRGARAREESARLLRHKIDELAGSAPVVVTGDFNATDDKEPYFTMTDSLNVRVRLNDTIDPSIGTDVSTFRGFSPGSAVERRIDYVFASTAWTTRSFRVLDDVENGTYPSDHLPVLVRLALRAEQ